MPHQNTAFRNCLQKLHGIALGTGLLSHLVTHVSLLSMPPLMLQEISLAIGGVSARGPWLFQRHLITVKQLRGTGGRVYSKPVKENIELDEGNIGKMSMNNLKKTRDFYYIKYQKSNKKINDRYINMFPVYC